MLSAHASNSVLAQALTRRSTITDPKGRAARHIAFSCAWTTVICALLLLLPLSVGGDSTVYSQAVLFTGVVIWVSWSIVSVRGTLFSPYGLFFISMTLFTAGQPILYCLTLDHSTVLRQFSPEEKIGVMLTAMLSMVAFHLGGLVSFSDARRRSFSSSQVTPAVRVASWGFLCVGAVFSMMSLGTLVQLSSAGSYSDLYRREAATGLGAFDVILADFLIAGVMFTLATSRARTAQLISTSILLAFGGLQLYLGYRSRAIAMLVAMAWLIDVSIVRIRRSFLIGMAAASLVLFPLITTVRTLNSSERLAVNSWVDAYTRIENPIQSSMAEMGDTLKVLAFTMRLVPESRPFDFGASYFWSALGVFPNITSDIHISALHSLSRWLIWTVDPWTAAMGGGLGFSLTAEGYLNGGIIGVFCISALIGYAIARLDHRAATTLDPLKIALAASILTFLLKWPRADSQEVFRAVIWYCVVPYFVCRILNSQRRKTMGIVPMKTTFTTDQ